MKWNTSRTARENASAKLPKLAEKYFAAGRKAARAQQTPKQLHQFRIRTKRFRYALELFRPIYGPTMDRHLKALRGIQDALGKVNDYQSMEELVTGDKKLVAHLQTARKQTMKQFRNEWKKFDSKGQLEHWKAYLRRARSPSRPRKAAHPAKKTEAAPIATGASTPSFSSTPMLK